MVHVVGPYREQLGAMPQSEWIVAVTLNGLGRWAVPVFIMITGALMLADPRPFDSGYFLRRRVMKVLVPFLLWSVVYALLGGLSASGFAAEESVRRLVALPVHETYYHLGFFYYFIPLYLLVWPLRQFVARVPRAAVLALLGVWLTLSALFLAGSEGLWSADLVMFGGYLLLGYVLWRVSTPPLPLLAAFGLVALAAGCVMVVVGSLEAGEYAVGRWYSYKTLNVVCVAAFLFVLALRVAPRLSSRAERAVTFAGRHTLGIYLLHPLFLWPMREFALHDAHPLLVVPFWVALAGGLALGTSVLLSRLRATAWMVP